jgi:FkbH-like protein
VNDPLKAILISDFNPSNFHGILAHDAGRPAVDVIHAHYGPVQGLLLNSDHEAWSTPSDFAVVWTRPESGSPSWAARQAGERIDLDTHLAEVDEYARLLLACAKRVRHIFVPAWCVPPAYSAGGLLDFDREQGDAYALSAMNMRLADRLAEQQGIHVLNTQRWVEAAGPAAFNPKLWYMAKVPFGPAVFQRATAEIKSALSGLLGQARKLVVVDLDNTLWGGIVGDIGWENVALGGHDPEGEAFADFQRAIKTLVRRGVLLAIVSKNEEQVALQAVDRHPEMVLRREDFCGWRINWSDKAQNLHELAAELNLGLQSVVFIDDSPVERARVREALPEVLVPDWPEDRMLYRQALMSLPCFNTGRLTREDAQRTEMYRAEKARSELKSKFTSLDEWLKTLETRVRAEPLDAANLARAVQLLNKTNQFNLTTRRMAEQELLDWRAAGDRHVWTFRVADKLGDAGLTGLASLEVKGDRAQIVDWVLSCRVFGRRIEETMLHVLLAHARERGLRQVVADFVPTEKNKPCLQFLESAAARATRDDDRFAWNVAAPFALPDGITLE